MIRLIAARTSQDKDRVFQLRQRVFVEEERRFDHRETRLIDRFDCLNETLNLLALDGDTPVASMRLTLENNVGHPCCEHYDFTPILRGLRGKCASIGWLCCVQSHRHHPGLVAGLFKLAVRKIRQGGNRHMISTVHPPILPLLASFGALPVGDVFHSEALGVPMQPIYCDFDNFRPGAREVFADPLNVIMDESDERRIYKRDEVIVRKGEVGDTAFLVMRGSVRVVPDPEAPPSARAVDGARPAASSQPAEPARPAGRSKDLLFGQGQVFGELALLDGGPRTTTVVAHSREADLMVWSQVEFLRQLQSRKDMALALCKVLASRLRRNIEGTMVTLPSALLARIMLDASRGGEQTVNADWLSRQCGIVPEDMEEILVEWSQRGWVAKGGDGLRVLQPAQLKTATAP